MIIPSLKVDGREQSTSKRASQVALVVRTHLPMQRTEEIECGRVRDVTSDISYKR